MTERFESELERSGRDPVEELAEEFLERHRRGEAPEVEEYAARHPELAARIRAAFPLLRAMEVLGPDQSSLREPLESFPALRAVGEYRILREVGRGGMGIVYEAEQEPLGRRVALKVLPAQSFASETDLERFRLEARSAARLHHTNIVPVFGTGEADGVQYYSMQFIRGQSLSEVISELRRMRTLETPGAPSRSPAREPSQIVHALSCGGWTRSDTALRIDGRTDGRLAAFDDDALGEAAEDFDHGDALSVDTETSAASTYYRRAARVAQQVADGLAYAHAEGVLHRDIKPSNVLLDTRGTAWITDFGLAKADDSADLTASGSLLGTLRYMAPERFQGGGDARADVYALGATLYELLTLRPAFGARDRAQLIRDISTREPVAPRRLDPRIPKDLETVVLKALAKSPRDRYGSAAKLSEDLGRFLRFEPVVARRATAFVRAHRWCQRNPTIAALSVVIAILVVSFAVVAVGAAFSLRDERDATRELLVDSKLYEARAIRLGGLTGRRSASLEAVRVAAGRRSDLEVRNELIGVLANADLEIESEHAHGEDYVLDDGSFALCVRTEADGTVNVHDEPGDGDPRVTLPGRGAPVTFARFDASDEWLAVGHGGARPSLTVWQVETGERALFVEGVHPASPVDFGPDAATIAHLDADLSVVVRRIADGAVLGRSAPRRFRAMFLRVSPAGDRLAVVDDERSTDAVELLTFPGLESEGFLHHAARVDHFDWHQDGRTLATACYDRAAHVWDTDARREIGAFTGGHDAEVTRVEIAPQGDFLATTSWDGRTSLWRFGTRRKILGATGNFQKFSRDGERLRFRVKPNVTGVWRVVRSEVLDVVGVPTDGIKGPYRLSFSGDGRWLAAPTALRGTRIISVDAPAVAATIRNRVANAAWFEAEDSVVWLSGQRNVTRWGVEPADESPGAWTISKVETLDLQSQMFGVSEDRSFIARRTDDGFDVNSLEEGYPKLYSLLHESYAVDAVFSRTNRWVATTVWVSEAVRIWDVATGHLVREIETPRCSVAFSPDERYFALSAGDGVSVYRTETWECVKKLERRYSSSATGILGFSPDSRSLVWTRSPESVELVWLDGFEPYATLESSEERQGFCRLEWSHDGGHIAVAVESNAILIWDLRAIRAGLRRSGLDWDAPRLPPRPDREAPRSLRVLYDAEEGWPEAFHIRDRHFYGKKVRLLTRLIELEPSAELHVHRARELLRTYRRREALADLEIARGLEPDAPLLEEIEELEEKIEAAGQAR